MKTRILAATALIAVMGLLLSSMVGGQITADGEEGTIDPIEEQGVPFVDFLKNRSEETADHDYCYEELVKRSYHFLTTGFVSQHCDWAKLPQVRSIYTANSSGRWMYNNLPRINATGEARIIDRDGDGVAELVIWKHIIAKDNVLDDTNGSIISRLSGNASVLPVDVNTSVVRNSAFVLIYMDRDGDGTPEIIILSYWNRIRVILSPGNIPIAGYNFNWKGSAYDMDDDGAWNVESFRTSELFKMDMDNDGFDEIIKGHEATYRRIDRAGRPIWDRISATALNKLYIDRNSDGNPEIRSGRTVTGCMVDRNGDLLPEIIKIRVTNGDYKDRDSDGNPEIRGMSRVSLLVKDKNSDGNPELVEILFRSREIIDRDSDGNWDVIIIRYSTFRYIDRNSDGRPEEVVIESGVRKIYPGDLEVEDRPEKERRERENNERKVEPDDTEKEDRKPGISARP